MAKDKQTLAQRNNLIRASGATTNSFAIFIAGFAGALAGTVSMAMGEYVSVHSQNDAQIKAKAVQNDALNNRYDDEFAFVQKKYEAQGISERLANKATQEMMAKDSLGTTVRERYGFTLHHEMSDVGAAIASMVSFPLGSLLPMLAITLLPPRIRIAATGVAVLIALAITGYSAAHLSGANEQKATLRNVVAGVFTMIVTFYIGTLIGR